MLNKQLKFLLAVAAMSVIAVSVVSIIKITNPVFAASPCVHGLKVFIQDQERLESAVNNWFSLQSSIAVDGFSLVDYNGGDYLAVISYCTSDTSNLSTRLKLIGGENSEADAQDFLSSLDASQAVRFISATPGYYSRPDTVITVPIIFIVYE